MTTVTTNDDRHGRSTDLVPHGTNGVIANQPVSILVAAIHHEVEQADASMRDAVAHAIRAGDLLIEAKATAGHGKWLPWVKANLPFDARTAQMYMRLAKHREDAKRLSHLGISGVLKELARQQDIAERIAAAEEQVAQERERVLGSATHEQLTLRDLDLSPETERLLVSWLEAVAAPFVDEGIEDRQLEEQEYKELVALEHGLRRLQLLQRRRAARENGAVAGADPDEVAE